MIFFEMCFIINAKFISYDRLRIIFHERLNINDIRTGLDDYVFNEWSSCILFFLYEIELWKLYYELKRNEINRDEILLESVLLNVITENLSENDCENSSFQLD